MSEQSLRTKKNHQQVWEVYCEKLKSYGNLVSDLTRSRIHKDVADLTDYSTSRVKQILNSMTKTKLCVCF